MKLRELEFAVQLNGGSRKIPPIVLPKANCFND